jgi:isoleucyl-tRNA synthetase
MTTDQAQKQQKKNYKQTLNLPQTPFPMEAKLVLNEPVRLQAWQAERLYDKLMAARANSPKGKWVLHDGPPFANGDIHIGHVINKVLKDVVERFRSMQGYQTPYVPGWDCHGLPIEHKIQQELGPKLRQMSVVDVRKRCYEYAAKYVKIQSQQFQRLGILGEWSNPYLTMSPEYEAETLDVFARFVEHGLVYKQLKPVSWSVSNQTALAEAELEYQDVTDTSVYVEFPASGLERIGKPFGLTENDNLVFVVWTTTPWTLPANLAIAVNPDVQYALVRYHRDGVERVGVVAADLVKRVFERPGVTRHEVLKTFPGSEIVGAVYQHPFVDRKGKILAADYVTTTDGSGLVHTAPGHGEEDYELGVKHGLEVYSPVLADGRFDDTASEWLRGKTVWEANPLIVNKLRDQGVLLGEEQITHSYPHDWRSKKPIIFRATEQWFIAMDKPFSGGATLRGLAREAIEKTSFVPDWGKHRIMGMLDSRPDWCISRQRAWGLPIPVFYNDKGEPLLTPQSVRAVAKHFRTRGADSWFTDDPDELLGSDFRYPPGFAPDKLRKEQDIFDVWFESGSSWRAVLQCRSYLRFPADLYLEGSDQHRGWFQLSLLPGLGATGQAPFKQVLTHGFAVKPDGRKVSKSDPEYVTATKEIDTHGADLLRLWVCSLDFEGDLPTSPQIIREFGDKYRKIRNTLRYLLSNLYDFNPATDAQEVPLNSLDGWASYQLDELIRETLEAYDKYQFHRSFRLLHDFCAVQVSALYGNAMKDRLYCEAPNSPLRRRTQTVMHRMIVTLAKLLAPMIVFSADEAWEHIQHKPAEDRDLENVHLTLLPQPSGVEVSEEQKRQWQMLFELRDQAMLQIDPLLRKFPKQIKPLDMEAIVRVDDDALRRQLEAYGPDLEDLIGVGFASFAEKGVEGPAVSVEVVDRRDTYQACARSWKRRPDVGSDPDYPDLSARDAAAVRTPR